MGSLPNLEILLICFMAIDRNSYHENIATFIVLRFTNNIKVHRKFTESARAVFRGSEYTAT